MKYKFHPRIIPGNIVNEVIRAILNLFISFLQEDFTHTQSTKSIQANKNKKDSIFMCIKSSKRKKVACLTFCAFYAFCAFCALCVCMKSSCKKIIKRFKIAPITSFTIP